MKFPAAVPEIPAASLDKAAAYYVKTLGFTFDWDDEKGGIAGISRGTCRLFITNPSFRSRMATQALPFSGSISRVLAQSREQG